MIATRNGGRMYEVGRTGQHGINYPWIGRTYSEAAPIPERGEIAAAVVYESPSPTESVAVRWAVVND